MIFEIAIYPIFGRPLVLYFGILTLLLLVSTAYLGHAINKGKISISIKWHMILAGSTVAFALIHAIFGLSINFNF